MSQLKCLCYLSSAAIPQMTTGHCINVTNPKRQVTFTTRLLTDNISQKLLLSRILGNRICLHGYYHWIRWGIPHLKHMTFFKISNRHAAICILLVRCFILCFTLSIYFKKLNYLDKVPPLLATVSFLVVCKGTSKNINKFF